MSGREIDLDWEEHQKTCNDTECKSGGHQDWAESGESGDKLIGFWKKDEQSGLYEPDETKEYAAIVRSDVVQVVWSQRTVRVPAMCSPCYPGQADLDSGEVTNSLPGYEGHLAYTLPADFFSA